MQYNEEIKKIIEIYLENGKNYSAKYFVLMSKISLYKELLNLLNTDLESIKENMHRIILLLDTIYGNSSYSEIFKKRLNVSLSSKENFKIKDLINIFIKDANKWQIETEYLSQELISYNLLADFAKSFLIALKYHSTTKKEVIEGVKNILGWANGNYLIDAKTMALLINELNFYNDKTTNKINHNPVVNNSYQKIPTILSMGFQEVDEIEVSPNSKIYLDNLAHAIYGQILNIENSEIETLLDEYKKGKTSDSEFDYLLNRIMELLQKELLYYYSFILDKDICINNNDRKEATNDYFRILAKFLSVRKYYEIKNQILDNDVSDLESGANSNIDENDKLSKKTIVFSTSLVNPLNAKIISDLKEIPGEYYEEIEKLLDGFENNTLPSGLIKPLSGASNLYEIRGYQIRIMFKICKNNIFCILGVFIKKDTRAHNSYKTFSLREAPVDIESALAIAPTIKDNLYKKLRSESRTGNYRS